MSWAVGLTCVWGQPETDIYLVKATQTPKGWQFEAPTNITPRKGYDNQPRFSPDGQGLLFVSASSTGDTDIYQYDLASRTSKRITRTKTRSEYSPQYAFNGSFISAVVVEEDGSQRIWRYDPATGTGSVLMPKLAEIGYYAWLANKQLAYFKLGTPPTLQQTKTKAQKPKQVADDIGRCLQLHPDGKRLFYVDKSDSTQWMIKSWSKAVGAQRIVATLPGSEDFCFTPDGSLWMGKGNELFAFDPNTDQDWQRIASFPIGSFYRLDLSPDGTYLAMVAYQGERP